MYKYIEELNSGDSFEFENAKYLLSTDYKKNGSKLAFSLLDGSPRWIKASDMVKVFDMYYINEDNAISAIKNQPNESYSYQKTYQLTENITSKTSDIS